MIRMFTLASYRCLKLTPNPTPPPSTQLHCTRNFAHVREYTQVTLSTSIASFDETTRIFHHFHPLVKVDIPPFIDDFHVETKVFLD
jgi:hypothetical protein